MKKYQVTIYTTCDDLTPTCQMDEHMLQELLDFGQEEFFKLEDDTLDKSFMLQRGHIVGIEWEEIK